MGKKNWGKQVTYALFKTDKLVAPCFGSYWFWLYLGKQLNLFVKQFMGDQKYCLKLSWFYGPGNALL